MLKIVGILIVCLAGKGIFDDSNEKCTKENRQRSIYVGAKYQPNITQTQSTSLWTSYTGVQLAPLREFGKSGFYAATMMRTRSKNGQRGPGGYFGVQWKGKKRDMLLFSIWDKGANGLFALPMHENCKRNCQDCRGKKTTGTKCPYQLDYRLQEEEEIIMKVEREPVESTTYQGVTYKGHVWKVTAEPIKGKVLTVGRILFTDKDLEIDEESSNGIDSGLNMFLEPLGCQTCGAFSYQVRRKGPYVTAAAGDSVVPKLIAAYVGNYRSPTSDKPMSCYLFDVVSEEFGSVKYIFGNKAVTPSWDGSKKHQLY